MAANDLVHYLIVKRPTLVSSASDLARRFNVATTTATNNLKRSNYVLTDRGWELPSNDNETKIQQLLTVEDFEAWYLQRHPPLPNELDLTITKHTSSVIQAKQTTKEELLDFINNPDRFNPDDLESVKNLARRTLHLIYSLTGRIEL